MKTGLRWHSFAFGVCILCIQQTRLLVRAGACTSANSMGWGLPGTILVNQNDDGKPAGTGYLYPAPSYTAQCCGEITSVDTCHSSSGTTKAQVWRPISGSIYQLVWQMGVTGSSCFNSLVPAANKFKVKPGDVVGWYSSLPNIVRNGIWLTSSKFQLFGSAPVLNSSNDWSGASTQTFVLYAMKYNLGPTNVPSFSNLNANVLVYNTNPVGTVVYTVGATDLDNDTLTITRTDTITYFSFDSLTYQVTIGSSLLGVFGANMLVFEVTDNWCSATGTLTITVLNVPPTIHNLANSTSISEAVKTATLLYTVSVTDPTETVTCTLIGTSDPFTMRQVSNGTNYGIYTNANPNFNYDAKNTYTLTINCSDGFQNVNGTYTVYLIRNTQPNITNLPATKNVSTASTTGSVVYTVLANDIEGDQLYFNMTCTPSPCPFQILTSGVIQAKQNLNGLSTVGYDLAVWVYDGKTLVGPRTLTIDITNINGAVSINNLPLSSALTVSENTPLSTVAFQVNVIDPDVSDTHVYTMTSSPGSGMSYFSISSTGQVSTSGAVLNFEALGNITFAFTITVSDGTSADTKILKIQILDQNEAPTFNQAGYAIFANEAAGGTTLTDPGFTVADPDANETKFYNNDCGNDTGLFSMSSATGRLSFSSDYDYDLGTLPTNVICRITVTDSGGLTATATLTITLNNINDNAPTFTQSNYTYFAQDGSGLATIVGTVTAIDHDRGSYGIVTYSLDQSTLAREYFGIVSDTGAIYVRTSLTPIGTGNSVTFLAIATDRGGLTTTATVTVKIALTTTTSTTTTTVRYKTFIEDGRNIAWIVLSLVVLAVTILFLFRLACKISKEGLPNLKCCKKNVVKRPPSEPKAFGSCFSFSNVREYPPTKRPPQPSTLSPPTPGPATAPASPPPPPPRPPYEGYDFWKDTDFKFNAPT